jgi:hypothetical protein
MTWKTVCWRIAVPCVLGFSLPQPSTAVAQDLRFAVLGHLRGDLSGPNPKLAEVLSEVSALQPDLLFLTGDMIWGDVNRDPVDSILVERDWDLLDSALATVGVPSYRTPGNHDINDPVTRDIYLARYGPMPKVVNHGNLRFVMLTSSWIPSANEPGKHRYIRGKDLGTDQLRFLQDALADTASYQHAFVFLHHLLWWGDEASPWWREVHPLLQAGKVAAVFSGDYGPMKFSHMARDGIQYYQSSIEDSVSVAIQQALPSSWRLSSQFDNFLLVTVEGPAVDIAVHTVTETSSGAFTPQRWNAIAAGANRPPSVRSRVWDLIGSPKRLVLLVFLVGLYTGFVAWLAVRWGRAHS